MIDNLVLTLNPIHIAFLGCGFISSVHSRHLRTLSKEITCSYASRDNARAESFRRQFNGVKHWGSYADALNDSSVDAVVIAVPPFLHRDLAIQALEAGKHVLVEKPAFPNTEDYEAVKRSRDQANKVVLVGENDHYKPLAICLRRLLAENAIGEMIFAHFTTLAKRLKPAGDWRNDENMAGGDAFFEEGIHWLHLANSLGPRIKQAKGYTASLTPIEPDTRPKSTMVAFRYDNGAVGALFYSREVPSLLRGIRVSKLFGRKGIISFESNGAFVLTRGSGFPRLTFPGFRDIRGYQAMYRDFVRAIRENRPPEMSLETAIEDQRLMDQIAL